MTTRTRLPGGTVKVVKHTKTGIKVKYEKPKKK